MKAVSDQGEAEQREPLQHGSLRRTRNPISIAFLFYVVTMCAIVSACLRTLAGNELVTARWVLLVLIVGSVVGVFLGSLVGVLHFRSLIASMVGAMVGLCVGALAGVLTLVSADHFWEIASVAFLGSWLMIVVMLVAARFQNPVERSISGFQPRKS